MKGIKMNNCNWDKRLDERFIIIIQPSFKQITKLQRFEPKQYKKFLVKATPKLLCKRGEFMN